MKPQCSWKSQSTLRSKTNFSFNLFYSFLFLEIMKPHGNCMNNLKAGSVKIDLRYSYWHGYFCSVAVFSWWCDVTRYIHSSTIFLRCLYFEFFCFLLLVSGENTVLFLCYINLISVVFMLLLTQRSQFFKSFSFLFAVFKKIMIQPGSLNLVTFIYRLFISRIMQNLYYFIDTRQDDGIHIWCRSMNYNYSTELFDRRKKWNIVARGL